MTFERPFAFRWNAEQSVMTPLRLRQADVFYTDGQIYTLGVVEERSSASHRHFHAAVHQAWLNLPEALSERFPSDVHLRKYATIRAGYCNVKEYAAASNAEALRVASYVRGLEDYAVVVVKGSTVQHFTARSTSYRSMPRDEFQAMKTAVMGIISEMVGVTPSELAKAAA